MEREEYCKGAACHQPGLVDMPIDRRTVIIGATALAAVRTAESATPETVEVCR